MNNPTQPKILLLPGWQNSGPGHWQTRWESQHGFERVQQDDWHWPRRGDWMIRLEETLLANPDPQQPTLLVAHSLGCHLVAAWAAHSQHAGQVVGALLVAPPDLQRANLPPQVSAWATRPGGALAGAVLPFATIAVLSADDPFCDAGRGLQMAEGWGCEIHTLGAAGHVNADSGLGDWPEGLGLLADLARRSGMAGSLIG